jgi:glucan phosphoethanolaminetransferase (alkaline phosphatase superfamily)
MKLFSPFVIKQSWIFAIVYFLLCNTPCILNKISICQNKGFLLGLELTKEAFFVLMFSYMLFAGLSINRFVFYISSFLLFISGACFAYYLQMLKVQPSLKVITAIIHFESRDALELINPKLFIWLAFVAIIWFVLIKKYLFEPKTIMDKLIALGFLFVSILIVTNLKYKVFKRYFPSQYLIELNNYANSRFQEGVDKFDISSLKFADNSSQDLDVVLIIGESARFDRFGINGYHRPTSPKLEAIENLQKFKSQTYDSLTDLSVPAMLSRNFSQNPNDLEESTFLSVFNKLGFATYWLGSQKIGNLRKTKLGTTFYDEASFLMTPGASFIKAAGQKDEDLLPFLENALNKKRRNLVVLHTLGSHWDYATRYTKDFEVFKPVCETTAAGRDQSSCTKQEISNMYDNSILYTDDFIVSVINKLRNRNAILFYTSDHGESLGENGVFGHGGDNIEEQMNVPFFVWTSDKFKAANPEMYSNLSKNNNREINYKFLFHSILDCSNIKGDIIDKNFSLCK